MGFTGITPIKELAKGIKQENITWIKVGDDDHDYSIVKSWGGKPDEIKVKGRKRLEKQLRKIAKEYDRIYDDWLKHPEKRESVIGPDDFELTVYDDTEGTELDDDEVRRLSGVK